MSNKTKTLSELQQEIKAHQKAIAEIAEIGYEMWCQIVERAQAELSASEALTKQVEGMATVAK